MRFEVLLFHLRVVKSSWSFYNFLFYPFSRFYKQYVLTISLKKAPIWRHTSIETLKKLENYIPQLSEMNYLLLLSRLSHASIFYIVWYTFEDFDFIQIRSSPFMRESKISTTPTFFCEFWEAHQDFNFRVFVISEDVRQSVASTCALMGLTSLNAEKTSLYFLN